MVFSSNERPSTFTSRVSSWTESSESQTSQRRSSRSILRNSLEASTRSSASLERGNHGKSGGSAITRVPVPYRSSQFQSGSETAGSAHYSLHPQPTHLAKREIPCPPLFTYDFP